MPRRRFLATTVVLCLATPALAEPPWANLQNEKIEVQYLPPINDTYRSTYQFLMKRRVLEELSAFLSPLQLPLPLKITMMECGETNSYYSKSDGVRLCYELSEFLMRIAPGTDPSEAFNREDVIVGTFVQIALHEVGHAVFDLLQVPILGREEDAADQIAAFVSLNFGPKVARRILGGSAQFWRLSDVPMDRTAFADEHSTPLQRYYNTLCIAYGGQPATLRDLVDAGFLPAARAAHCSTEYEQVRRAFAETILPYVDPQRLKLIQSIDWSDWGYPG